MLSTAAHPGWEPAQCFLGVDGRTEKGLALLLGRPAEGRRGNPSREKRSDGGKVAFDRTRPAQSGDGGSGRAGIGARGCCRQSQSGLISAAAATGLCRPDRGVVWGTLQGPRGARATGL